MTDTPPAADAALPTSTPPVIDTPAPKTLSELAAAKAAQQPPGGALTGISSGGNASAQSTVPTPPAGALTSSSPELASQVTKTAARFSTEDALASLGACLLTGGPVKDGKIFMEWLKDYTNGV